MAESKNADKNDEKDATKAEREGAKAKREADREAAKAEREADKTKREAEQEADKTKREAEQEAAKAEREAEQEAAKAEREATKEAEKAAKEAEKAAKEAEKAAKDTEETPEEVTPVEPTVSARSVGTDTFKVAAQDGPRATSQDAPAMGTPMGAVNDSNPTAAVNRFSGVYPNNTYPLVAGKLDPVQEQLKQVRDEGARTRRVSSTAARAPHPPLASKYTTNDHAARRVPAPTAGTRYLRTTTRVALSVGNTLIPVASTTNIEVGDVLTLSRGLAEQESVTVTVVDTDATGPRFQIGAPGLLKAHASGATVHEYVA